MGGHTWVQYTVGAEWDIPQNWTTRLLSSVFSYLAQAEHTNAKHVGWRSTTSSPTKLGGGGGCYSNKAKRKMATTGAANGDEEVKKGAWSTGECPEPAAAVTPGRTWTLVSQPIPEYGLGRGGDICVLHKLPECPR